MEKFLEALKNDETLANEFFSKKTPEDLYAAAKPYIGEMSIEEFIAKLKALSDASKTAEDSELSDDDVSIASGGDGNDPSTSTSSNEGASGSTGSTTPDSEFEAWWNSIIWRGVPKAELERMSAELRAAVGSFRTGISRNLPADANSKT